MKSHITNITNKAMITLSKLYRFKNLNIKTRRKLYLALVNPLLLYPCIPLHVASNKQMIRLQRVQNKGINFVLGRGRRRGETTESRHQQTNIQPINVILQKRATNIWNSIFDNVTEEILQELEPINCDRNPREFQSFPSSMESKDAIASPYFTSADRRWLQ